MIFWAKEKILKGWWWPDPAPWFGFWHEWAVDWPSEDSDHSHCSRNDEWEEINRPGQKSLQFQSLHQLRFSSLGRFILAGFSHVNWLEFEKHIYFEWSVSVPWHSICNWALITILTLMKKKEKICQDCEAISLAILERLDFPHYRLPKN